MTRISSHVSGVNTERYVQKYFNEANLQSIKYKLRDSDEPIIIDKLIINDDRFCAVSGHDIIPIHLFEKPTSRSPFIKESLHFNAFHHEITKISSVRINNESYEFDDFVRINSSCKADFALIKDNKEIFWISHKDGTTDRHFVHFGGISHIKNDPAIKYFVSRHKEQFEYQPNYTVGMLLNKHDEHKQLCLQSVYGNEFGKCFGRNNVNVIIQGEMKIEDNNLVANKIIENGNLLSDKQFMLYSRISLDRSDCGIKNCRLSIGTTESRLVKHWIKYET